MRKTLYSFITVTSYILTNICYYFFSYCYQLHTYKGEGYANIKNLNSNNYIPNLIFFILFSLVTTIFLYLIFRNSRKNILNLILHLGIVFILNYSICIIIPIYSFFYDDWTQLVFSIWNKSLFIFNILFTISITLILYLIDITNKKFPRK